MEHNISIYKWIAFKQLYTSTTLLTLQNTKKQVQNGGYRNTYRMTVVEIQYYITKVLEHIKKGTSWQLNIINNVTQNVRYLHPAQKLRKQHLLITASFINSLHSGHCSSGWRSLREYVKGNPRVSFSNETLHLFDVESKVRITMIAW